MLDAEMVPEAETNLSSHSPMLTRTTKEHCAFMVKIFGSYFLLHRVEIRGLIG